MNIYQDFRTVTGKTATKWIHYFPIYEKHFAPWRNKTLTFLEIGVFDGGSIGLWQRFFGPMATIVGIDINSACKKHEDPNGNVHVRIGDQSDPKFLQSLVDEFGPFDIVLDDGSHICEHQKKTFEFLYPKISKNGVYMIEDTHTSYWKDWGGGLNKPDSFINVCKGYIDELNADFCPELEPTFLTHNTFGISFYDSIVAF